MRVYIVDIVDPREGSRELEQRMLELERLVDTYGWLVVVKTIQKRQQPDYKTYIGSGKLEEIIQDMVSSESDLLIVGNILKPSQLYAINSKLARHPLVKSLGRSLQARDKVDLILKIFDRHAKSAEAKLQIQLAAIKHMGPRIYGMGIELSKQWGIGSSWWGAWATRWLGETNTERMRRQLAREALSIEKKLAKYEQMRDMHRSRREKLWFVSFWIVGYTNAGKSSLMNALSKKDVYADDKLFATLGTRTWKVYLPDPSAESPGEEVLLIDTIGFIRDLPPQLIKAFASTLEDSIQSSVLLHVVDVSDPDYREKSMIVEDVLAHIGADQDVLYIFNKSDRIDESLREDVADQYYGKEVVFVSALTWEGITKLKTKMYSYIH